MAPQSRPLTYLRHVIRSCLPHAVIERRRRVLQLKRLGLTLDGVDSADLEHAVKGCRFDLWPTTLRMGGWMLVDVGANVGDFIRATSRLVQPVAVIAIEPLPSCHAQVEQALTLVSNGVLVRAAVGAVPGEVELNCTANSKMASVLIPEPDISEHYFAGDFAISERVKVPLRTLDDVVPAASRVGLLKIDVQGYEMQVLRGATRTLRQTDALLIEVNYTPHYSGAVTFDELHAFLNSRGFNLYGISAPYSNGPRPLWADAMYVRNPEAQELSR